MKCGSDIAKQSLRHALQGFGSKAASDLLPPELSELLTAAKLILSKKKSSPEDVRPIACGETLRRVLE